jgi:hypothetical protein
MWNEEAKMESKRWKFTVELAMKEHRGVEVQLYSFFKLG